MGDRSRIHRRNGSGVPSNARLERVVPMVTVDARDEPGRIEIELTSNDPTGPHGPARDPLGRPLVSGPIDDHRGAPDDRRLLGVAALVGVLGLAIGVTLGRIGRAADDVATATVPPSTVIDGPAARPIASPDATAPVSSPSTAPATAPTTSLPSRPTMTSVVAIGRSEPDVVPAERTSIAVDPAAARLPIEIVGRGVDGSLIRLDLATGEMTTQPLDPPAGPPVVLAAEGWSAIPAWDGREGRDGWTVITDDGAVSIVEMPGVVLEWRHASPGLFWAFGRDGVDRLAVEIDISGAETGRVISLPGSPTFADPNGDGMVVTAPGGVYSVGEATTARITSGQLVALGRSQAVAYECDDALECGHVVIERATGARRPVALAFPPGTTIDAVAAWTTAPPLTGEEDAALVLVSDQRTGVPPRGGVLDLLTGEFTEVTGRGDAAMMRWAPDGRAVIWLDRGRLRLFDRVTGESVDVAPELALMTAFTTRAALPSVDGG